MKLLHFINSLHLHKIKCYSFLINSITLLLVLISHHVCGEIDCDKTKVWGPGLDPENVIMPARYFFIGAVDAENVSLTSSPGKGIFNVNVFGKDEKMCKVWVNVLDTQDGTLIARYKVQNYCRNLTISIKCKQNHIPASPYQFSGITHADRCSCAVNDNIEDWLEKYGCRKEFKQMHEDLNRFHEIDFDILYPIAEETLFKDHQSKSVCDYVIKNNEIFRKCHGLYTGFKMFMDAILLSIVRKVRVPDLEILVNLGDWPLIKSVHNGTILPLFSWCGSNETYDIVMPTYDITESTLENMGRVTLDILSVQGNIEKRWNEKFNKLFWRGRDSSRERLKLVKLGREHSDLINASLTDFFFFKDLQDEYGPKEKRISFFKFFDHKYQMNMDGTVAAYRFPYLLASDSLIFKQDSHYYEHFYADLNEWKHYIPVKRDLSDLIAKIEWAMVNDEEAHKIAIESQKFVRNNLMPQDIICYHVQLFYEYSKKFSNEVKIRPSMEKVDENHQNCDCQSISKPKHQPRDYDDL